MLTAKLIMERFDKDHHLLERREQPSRSFVQGFIQLLYVAHTQIQSGAPYSMTDITGNARDIDSQAGGHGRYAKSNITVGSPPGDSQLIAWTGQASGTPWSLPHLRGQYIGIQVGTGVAAVIPTDNALQTRINHGRAGGQMEYGGCELINIGFVNPNGEFTIRRYFTNLSGGGITVEEVGIYAIGTKYDSWNIAGGVVWPFCIARDLTGGVAVADTELLRVTYVVQITV